MNGVDIHVVLKARVVLIVDAQIISSCATLCI